MEVYNTLGSGFYEEVYQCALEIELDRRSVHYIAQPRLEIIYKGVPLRHTFIPDFIAYEEVIVEIKAIANLGAVEESQVYNYLRAFGKHIGLLINFGRPDGIQVKRKVYG